MIFYENKEFVYLINKETGEFIKMKKEVENFAKN